MILKGSQRGGGMQLAAHLTRLDENDHVEVHNVRGFVSSDLTSALMEAYAVSRGTKCRQFLFSLSLSPPPAENVPVPVFENAIEEIEKRLGLAGQPRVIVFHEKEGRRHAHSVWSRIKSEEMKAINLSHTRLKLRDISRQLYFEHGWRMPRGLANSEERNPLNFTRAEWQRAKLFKKDPREIKELFRECWAMSDSHKAFAQALAARGYYLARGDERRFVAVDIDRGVYAIARWCGVRTKDVAARLGDPEKLSSVEKVKRELVGKAREKLKGFVVEAEREFALAADNFNARRAALVGKQRKERSALQQAQSERWKKESLERAQRFRKGLRGIWDRLTGTHSSIAKQNEHEVTRAHDRDERERQTLIERHLRERNSLQRERRNRRQSHTLEATKLRREIARISNVEQDQAAETAAELSRDHRRRRRRGPSPI